MSPAFWIDTLLALLLVALAVQVVIGRHLFRSIVFFVAFGLVMALIWARLGAPDLALADAAIGAGLTGALLLAAFRRLVQLDPQHAEARGPEHSGMAVAVAVLVTGLVATLGMTALVMTPAAGSAGRDALARLPELELGNSVAAVVLVYRGFDTLIEMVVLLTAWLGARVVAGNALTERTTVAGHELPLLRTLVAIIVPLTVVVAFHLLWIGADRPGGAFQAGSVLAASGVLLLLTGNLLPTARASTWMRLGLVAGIGGMLWLLLGPTITGGLPMGWMGRGALLFAESLMTLSIAATLMLLFAGAPGLSGARR